MSNRKKIFYISITIGIIFVLSIGVIILCSRFKPEVILTSDQQHYIAHGGGMYGGHIKSNSLEAVVNSLNSGIEYIELDLNMTTDNELAALHDWKNFRIITDNKLKEDKPMSLQEFKESKIFNEYTPLTGSDIVNLMETYPQMKLVTDKISDPEIIDRYFNLYRDRVIVECFRKEDYERLEKMGYLCYLSEFPESRLKHLINSLLNKTSIRKYRYVFNNQTLNKRSHLGPLSPYPWEFAVFSVDNRKQADSVFKANPNIRFIYIEDVTE